MIRPALRDRINPNDNLLQIPSGNRVFMQILEYCKELMAGGRLKSGDRLLPERELS